MKSRHSVTDFQNPVYIIARLFSVLSSKLGAKIEIRGNFLKFEACGWLKFAHW